MSTLASVEKGVECTCWHWPKRNPPRRRRIDGIRGGSEFPGVAPWQHQCRCRAGGAAAVIVSGFSGHARQGCHLPAAVDPSAVGYAAAELRIEVVHHPPL